MTTCLADRILDLEWAMFSRVKSKGYASCQSAPAHFRNIRGSLLDTWTPELLEAYCADLELATAQGRNLLAEKYARMEGQIPPLEDDPAIDLILDVETRWQAEVRERFPTLYQHCCRSTAETGDGREFAVYLRAELETYGYETRQLYFVNVNNAERAGRNLGIEALQSLVHRGGGSTLNMAEQQLRTQSPKTDSFRGGCQCH